MKFNFKIQSFQTEAVESVVRIFRGQPLQERNSYIRDSGKKELGTFAELDDDMTGYRNAPLAISSQTILETVQETQAINNIKQSESLVKGQGACSLDIEMETGTGKTYVYIKTMFELNKRYGWTKFIVVVPSIAIREGVKKSFEMTADHFLEQYGKNARYFVYDSRNLTALDSFSSQTEISVMIINTQAFAASLKEDGRNKEARIIYSVQDSFASRRPIDVISANRPIIILDEPQKMGGEITQKALANFNPLFSLNYSATHRTQHNLVYVLDALDAYNHRLVKRIEVKGFQVHNLQGTGRYLYLDSIVVSPHQAPQARLEFEIKYKGGTKRETRILSPGDDLYDLSNKMEQYREGYTIAQIDPGSSEITFLNHIVLSCGEIVGDFTESDMRRVQIRETILSHFEKEQKLFEKGIKTLSLFFIDEVSRYRRYDDDGNQMLGEYGEMFEQEYTNILNKRLSLFDSPYQSYLRSIEASATHAGYFSIDKKTGRSIDSTLKRGAEESDDISAYDLIMKNKERLLDFDEPVRFIFSHSALREGWDNPNIFQICTLKHSDNVVGKRQEVGRGLRLCVDNHGNRQDGDVCGPDVQKINVLTVIASESYAPFVAQLQKQIKENLYDRPSRATKGFFEHQYVFVDGKKVQITSAQSDEIMLFLTENNYSDQDGKITEKYRTDAANKTCAELPVSLQPMAQGIHKLIQQIFDPSELDGMIDDGNQPKIVCNKLNDNFYKKEFQELWRRLNHKYICIVDFDSQELIKKSIKSIDKELEVSQPRYTITWGEQKETMDKYALERGESFDSGETSTKKLKRASDSTVKYDLVGKIAMQTLLSRRTSAYILMGISPAKFALYACNPEEFISKVSSLIAEQRAAMVVEGVTYNTIDGQYDSQIFTAGDHGIEFKKAFRAKKSIQDYVATDGIAENSVEKRFASDLDAASEVCVYAKLPREFSIPTPVGDYSPDWAIAFYEGTVKHIFFVAETKGSMDSMQLRGVEEKKISCAEKLFNQISTENVRFHKVDSYQKLLDVMEQIP